MKCRASRVRTRIGNGSRARGENRWIEFNECQTAHQGTRYGRVRASEAASMNPIPDFIRATDLRLMAPRKFQRVVNGLPREDVPAPQRNRGKSPVFAVVLQVIHQLPELQHRLAGRRLPTCEFG